MATNLIDCGHVSEAKLSEVTMSLNLPGVIYDYLIGDVMTKEIPLENSFMALISTYTETRMS